MSRSFANGRDKPELKSLRHPAHEVTAVLLGAEVIGNDLGSLLYPLPSKLSCLKGNILTTKRHYTLAHHRSPMIKWLIDKSGPSFLKNSKVPYQASPSIYGPCS